jgi:hypothetical protein
MAFVTYADLVATIEAYLNRGDLTDRIPDFIRLAEARMQRELTPFSTRSEFNFLLSATTGRTSAIPSLAGVVELPFVGYRVTDANLTFNPASPLPQVNETVLLTYHRDFPSVGAPEMYAILGQFIAVYPFPNVPKDSLGVDSTYTIVTVMVGPTASVAVPITTANAALNPIYAETPDLYLYGALCESAPYLLHDERLPMWESRFRQIVKDVNRQHERLLVGTRPQFQPLARVF